MNHSTRGFTMVELMVTIAVAAVLMAIAVPSFANISSISRMRAVSSELAAHSYLARSEAIKRNRAVRLCASASGTSCDNADWNAGWIVLDNDEVVERHAALPAGYAIRSTGDLKQVTYQANGFGATGVTFRVCKTDPAGIEERVVTIDSSGKAFTRRTANGHCN